MNFLLYKLYNTKLAMMKKLIVKLVLMEEKGECHSRTLRRIFNNYHNIDVGMYSYGACFNWRLFHPGITVGRYCSISPTASARTRGHPLEFKSSHPLFFSSKMKLCKEDLVTFSPLVIGNDVWMGYNSIILPRVERIGDGAVIGANAVVTDNVPPYAVVAGVPAKVIRYRFSPNTIDKLLQEKWWDKDLEELKPHLEEFTRKYNP
ncbi:MAG: antibiotic acetyltransferase [Chitinivibrionales bacterium]|nr:antibiotic acetyltransferase [Chitinivibrionales bacterium]